MASYDRVWNFSAGPCALPVEVLETCRDEMLNYQGEGCSVMEMSHRSKAFVKIYDEMEANLREILSVPKSHKIFLYQGGATLQFSGVPLNLACDSGKSVDYLVTGQWGEKAFKEAAKYSSKVNAVCNAKDSKFTLIPDKASWSMPAAGTSNYVHYCMNETVNGVQFQDIPDANGNPLVADMSSDFMTRPIFAEKHAAIYAGAQKNVGPAGNCVMIVDESKLGTADKLCPGYLDWKKCADAESMHNTPSCYPLYVMGVYAKYTKSKGGLQYWIEQTQKKSDLLYGAIDGSGGFYSAPVAKDARSKVNVPFIIKGGDADLEKKFMEQAKSVAKCTTLAGHRSVGGLRASLYNGMPLAGVEALVNFMKDFASENA